MKNTTRRRLAATVFGAMLGMIGIAKSAQATMELHHLVWDPYERVYWCLGSAVNCDFDQ